MLLKAKIREDLENLEELASPHNQVKDVRLQDKLGRQNFQENKKKLNQLLIQKNTSETLRKL